MNPSGESFEPIEPIEVVLGDLMPGFDSEQVRELWKRQRGAPAVYKVGNKRYGVVRAEVQEHVRDCRQQTAEEREAGRRAIRRSVRQPASARRASRKPQRPASDAD